MSEYIVSARKYRPLTFDSVVGQHGLTTTLKNSIASGKLAHAYLFCGPRGVGKTTTARIFAKTINCFTPTANGDACGECESCRAFDEHRSFNIHELDAASNNSVEDIRTLIDEVRIPPQVGRYKVFIIDEVHMLSQAAFNAFLKTLEEPPAHVIFILATTEKHKILPTILSRCQIYDFNRMTVADTVAHLRNVADKEGYKCDDEALAVIAEKADGGMRDALSIFDQIAAFTSGDITYDKVVEHIGIVNTAYYFRLVDHLLAKEYAPSMLLLNEVLAKGFDAGLFINGMATHLRNVMMARDKSTTQLIECSEAMRQRYAEQAAKCSDKFIYRALRLCNTCDLNYRTSRNKRLLVEITLIEIAQDDDSVAGRPATKLKPIFELLLKSEATAPVANEQPSPTPATTPTTEGSVTPVASTTAGTAPSNHTTSTTGTPSIKRGSFGTSITAAFRQKQQKEETATEETPIIVNTDGATMQWNEDTLRLCWNTFIRQLPIEEQIMAGRMRAVNPTIIDDKTFAVTIENSRLLPDWQKMVRGVEMLVATHTGRTDIRMTINVEEEEIQKILSRPELFTDMTARNAVLAKLKEAFQLDIA